MNRTPYQGVTNIIRFNPTLFITAGAVIAIGIVALFLTNSWLTIIIALGILAALASLTLSLAASYLIYDKSDIYQLPFLKNSTDSAQNSWVNLNAGFDEISTTIETKFPLTKLHILDFYDPEAHTELSIARARKAYPPHPGTITTTSHTLPVSNNSIQKIIAFFSLHEIRDHKERVSTFQELHKKLTNHGELHLTEHLRDLANLTVYSMGAFHFHTRTEWLKTFQESGFKIKAETKTTPFVTTFTLIKV